MRFFEPVLKKRSDGSQPQTNAFLGDPYNLFESNNALNFHFFTSNGNVASIAWKVLLMDHNTIDPSIVINGIQEHEGIERLFTYLQYLNNYGIQLEYIVFKDENDWHNGTNAIHKVSVSLIDERIVFTSDIYNISSFHALLFEIQGTSMIMNKPLIYSTTELEGYLADMCQRTLSPIDRVIFPGDVDLILFQNEETFACVEFKKHTRSGVGILRNQSFMNYMRYDYKKYNGIAALTSRLNLTYFYNIIYSTRPDELDLVKIEKISTSLTLIDSLVMRFESREELRDMLLDYMR